MKRCLFFLFLLAAANLSAQSWTCKSDSIIHATYNPETGIWTPDIYYEILTFDSLGNLLTETAGEDDERTLYLLINTYDSASNLVLQIAQTSGTNVQKDTFAYDANGNRLFDKTFTWSGSSWHRYSVAMYDSFDVYKNPQLETDTEYYLNPIEITKLRYLYTYGGSGNITSKITQRFNDTLGVWINYSKAAFSVSGNDSLETDYGWRFTDSTWVVGEQYHNFWTDICNPSGIKTVEKNLVRIYPNPFTNALFTEPKVPFRLFDITGKEVDKNNLSQLENGVYILSSPFGNARVIKKE